MLFLKNSFKAVLLVMALTLASVAQAQKMADLLVAKDIVPGQWSSTPTQIPKGLEAHMKPENYCATQKDINQILNKSTSMFSGKNNSEISCSNTIANNTATEAVMITKCSFKRENINTENKYSIKRTSSDTWTFTSSGPAANGTTSHMQITMKYLGACTK